MQTGTRLLRGGCGSCGPTGVECGYVCVCVWWVCVECVECVECECPNMSILFLLSHALEARAHTP
jgi:hypothetical protein